jgi:acetyl-CoA synthetase
MPSKQLAEELKKHVRNIIGPVATFNSIYFVQGLPKTRSGKIMRRIVKAIVEGQTVGDVTTLEDKSAVDYIIKALANEPINI